MNKLKKALQQNEITFGAWLQIPHPAIIDIIGQINLLTGAKLDWICIDMEHGSIGFESMTNMIRAIERVGCTPVVRIPQSDYIWIHRVLDAGAEGLIIPMIRDRMELDYSCHEALYPPLGGRSYGFSRFNMYGEAFDFMTKHGNSRISIIPQIEHVEAIDNLEEILTHPHIDASFIGPLDLKGSIQFAVHKDGMSGFERAISKYLGVSRELEVPPGMHVVYPEDDAVKKAVDAGYKMIALGLDITFLRSGTKAALECIDQIQSSSPTNEAD